MVEEIYSPHGNYSEGADYWNYGTSFQVCFMSCLQDLFGHTGGIAETEGFMESGKFALYLHGTMETQFSYNDGGATRIIRILHHGGMQPSKKTKVWFFVKNGKWIMEDIRKPI